MFWSRTPKRLADSRTASARDTVSLTERMPWSVNFARAM